MLILLLHYLVKFRSRCLAVYNNEFILSSVGSEIINYIVTKTSNSYYFLKAYVVNHIISTTACAHNVFLYHERKW